MIAGIPGCAPDAHDAKLTATTFSIVVGTIKSAPRVAARLLQGPAVGFGIFESFFHFLPWVDVPCHVEIPCVDNRVLCYGCQLTTMGWCYMWRVLRRPP